MIGVASIPLSVSAHWLRCISKHDSLAPIRPNWNCKAGPIRDPPPNTVHQPNQPSHINQILTSYSSRHNVWNISLVCLWSPTISVLWLRILMGRENIAPFRLIKRRRRKKNEHLCCISCKMCTNQNAINCRIRYSIITFGKLQFRWHYVVYCCLLV